MNDLNVIETMKIDNCTIHICNNSIRTNEEQEKVWKEFSDIAYQMCKSNEMRPTIKSQ